MAFQIYSNASISFPILIYLCSCYCMGPGADLPGCPWPKVGWGGVGCWARCFFFPPGTIGWVQLAPSCQVCMRQAAHLEELQEELKKALDIFWILVVCDGFTCDKPRFRSMSVYFPWFSVWKNVQARTAETTAIEAATYRYNQCSKTATVPVSQALEQERKMHALGTPSWKNPEIPGRCYFPNRAPRQEKAEFTEKVEQMSNLQVQSESKLQTKRLLNHHPLALSPPFFLRKKNPSRLEPVGFPHVYRV